MGDVKIFYPEFVPNQILTNTQLNQMREHLESQELHTRLRLAGTGIVCGLNWAVVTSPNPAIELSEGYGISSDGELIEQCDPPVYTHRRAYADPDRDETGALRYRQWRDPADATHKTQRDIIELIDSATMDGTDPPEDAVALTAANLVGTAAITLNRVLVLYLEHEPVDLNSCLVTSCDNKGLNINVRVRALLVKESDLSAAPDCAAPPVLERIPRMHTIHELQKITNAERLTEVFGHIVAERAPVLETKIRSLFDSHAAFLDVDKFTDADLDALAGKLVGDGPAQYRYGAIVGFACAYNEAALAAYSLVEQCCPSGDFPRHLMLGALDGTPSFRNEFLPAAIRNVAQGELERVRMLFLRLRAMIDGLDFGDPPDLVVIQPSHTTEYALGRRALPYYFGRIAPDVWRPRPRCAVDADWPWRGPQVATGFDTDYAEASWLRIEGLIGKPHLEAANYILEKRDTFNVEFCLLRTYFDDRSKEEAALRDKIAELLAILIQQEHKGREAFAKSIADVTELANGRIGLIKNIDDVSSVWLKFRGQRELHCDWAALGRDYLEARSELFCIAARVLGMLERLRVAVKLADATALIGPGLDAMRNGAFYMVFDRFLAAILASPERWDTEQGIKGELDSLAGLDPLERLRVALRFALETLQAQLRLMLEKNLPTTLAKFDYEVFAARYREVVRGLIEFRLWTGVLGTVLTGANRGQPTRETGGDVPLHEIEAGSIEADLLALARSCVLARLATAYSAYEALRAKDFSLYHNLAKIDGLEHLAGVAKGGSFILVCDTSKDSGKVLADFSLERCLPCCCELDPDFICLPPLALPHVRVVKLLANKEKGSPSYLPVELPIFVGANDYDANGAGNAPKVTIDLLSGKSELGAELTFSPDSARVRYTLLNPFPGVIDRFRYRLKIQGKCSGEAIGEVALVFAVDPLITGGIEGRVFADPEHLAPDATVRVLGTNLEISTGSTGHFAFELVPAGSYGVQAFKGDLTSETDLVTVTSGATATVELRLKQPAASNGSVIILVLDPKEAAIPGARVSLTNDSGTVNRGGVTDSTGKIRFDAVPAGVYRASAQAPGFIANSVGPFPIFAGLSVLERIRLDNATIGTPIITVGHTAGTLGVDVVEATVKVRKTLADRHTKFVNVFNGATDDPGILTSDPYAKAAEFMASGLADPEKTEAQIAADYKETSSALVTAAKQSTGETRTAYQEMLSAVSMAYLDHVAASNPATLTPEATAEVKTVTKALKSAGVSLTAVQTQWSGEALTNNLGVNTAAGIGTLLG